MVGEFIYANDETKTIFGFGKLDNSWMRHARYWEDDQALWANIKICGKMLEKDEQTMFHNYFLPMSRWFQLIDGKQGLNLYNINSTSYDKIIKNIIIEKQYAVWHSCCPELTEKIFKIRISAQTGATQTNV